MSGHQAKQLDMRTEGHCFDNSELKYNSYDNYLRQGGYVFAGFCLFVCLSVCVCVSNITQKVMDGSF